jgi:hypothetical protein
MSVDFQRTTRGYISEKTTLKALININIVTYCGVAIVGVLDWVLDLLTTLPHHP